MSDELRPPAELLSRLPATFAAALGDQCRQWPLLFPAEQRPLRAQVDWLARLPRERFDQLFAPLLSMEKRMALPRWDTSGGLSVRDVGILARSPLYPQWRAEVEKVFSHIEETAGASAVPATLPRLLVCVLPPGIPPSEPWWPQAAKEGTWLALDRPFGEMLHAFAVAIAGRRCPPALDPVERTWVLASDTGSADAAGATVLSWDSLEPLRNEFLRRLNTVQRDLRSVDETSAELKRADISRLLPAPLVANARVREFVRSLFLSGNGSLVFVNSFVEWGASEALRRAQPQALVAVFGIRRKLKPFSSVVLFEDQHRSNPTPDEDDVAGSLVDAAMLAQYVYLGAQRVACYPGHTVTLLAAHDSPRVLVLSPPGVKFEEPAGGPVNLTALALRWLARG